MLGLIGEAYRYVHLLRFVKGWQGRFSLQCKIHEYCFMLGGGCLC